MPDATPLDVIEVVAAVRALLLKETERVDDPHFIPEDRAGWHTYKPIMDDAAGTTPEAGAGSTSSTSATPTRSC